MKIQFLVFVFIQISCNADTDAPNLNKFQNRASAITIIRDNWGIPHVYGKTDADAVFGLMYAQCEESYERVERNYIRRLGRMTEIEGEKYLLEDLQTRLIYDTTEAITDYKNSPAWLKELLDAFAGGINYYLEKNPDVQPRLLKHFEPWYPLLFTDGGLTATQTGGATFADLHALYGEINSTASSDPLKTRTKNMDGSNAFAIGPSRTASGKAILYINPHVNFYFRTEAHMVSENGLNAYGAVTWGQFFVFQGFNDNCGWMHTSSLADASDLYAESIVKQNDSLFYEYNDTLRKLATRDHFFSIINETGKVVQKKLIGYYTHHGPVIGKRSGKWLSLREENRSMNGLIQSWQRTKSSNYAEFKNSMQLRANNSCNTMYADKDGTIAYWHGNFIPARDTAFDYTRPLEGKIQATEWKGIHTLEELVHVKDPSSGWLQNCNSGPFAATVPVEFGLRSHPAYMAPDGENFRSARAIRLLSAARELTLDKIIAIGYDRYLAAFDSMLPPLFESYQQLKPGDSLYRLLKEPVNILNEWDRFSGTSSIATSLAVEWGYKIIDLNNAPLTSEENSSDIKLFSAYARKTPPLKRLELLRDVLREYERYYGTWKIPWGELVRFQRTSGDISQRFDDKMESLPVGLASSLFGCLPAYESVWRNTNKSYGIAGNSFVAAVEFGDHIKAKSVVTAGQFFQPGSEHFDDQAKLFLEGKFKDVNFYKKDVMKNKSREYHPGEKPGGVDR